MCVTMHLIRRTHKGNLSPKQFNGASATLRTTTTITTIRFLQDNEMSRVHLQLKEETCNIEHKHTYTYVDVWDDIYSWDAL